MPVVSEESGDEGEEEEEEPQVDDAMGKVEDSEEDKLDPELWDKEEEQCNEPRKELDQGNEGWSLCLNELNKSMRSGKFCLSA